MWRVPLMSGADCRSGAMSLVWESVMGTWHFIFHQHRPIKDFESKRISGKWNVLWHWLQLHSRVCGPGLSGHIRAHLWNVTSSFSGVALVSRGNHSGICGSSPALEEFTTRSFVAGFKKMAPLTASKNHDAQWGKDSQIEVSVMLQVHRHQCKTLTSYSPTCPVLTSFCLGITRWSLNEGCDIVKRAKGIWVSAGGSEKYWLWSQSDQGSDPSAPTSELCEAGYVTQRLWAPMSSNGHWEVEFLPPVSCKGWVPLWERLSTWSSAQQASEGQLFFLYWVQQGVTFGSSFPTNRGPPCRIGLAVCLKPILFPKPRRLTHSPSLSPLQFPPLGKKYHPWLTLGLQSVSDLWVACLRRTLPISCTLKWQQQRCCALLWQWERGRK